MAEGWKGVWWRVLWRRGGCPEGVVVEGLVAEGGSPEGIVVEGNCGVGRVEA